MFVFTLGDIFSVLVALFVAGVMAYEWYKGTKK